MKPFILFAVFCIATISFCAAQTLPSPSSQGIIGSQNSNGGLFNGTTTIGMPLFAATANNGATIPVSLSYSTSGIKVAQVSTPVGLGWNLNAGGTITRVIRGIPDEYASMIDNPDVLDHMKLDKLLNGNLDSEKDLFYLNFPGGGGRFIFEGDFNEYLLQDVWCNDEYADLQDCQLNCVGEACQSDCHNYTMSRLACDNTFSWSSFQTLPYSDINITYYFDGFTDGYWEVTDMRGVKYEFKTSETTNSVSTEPDGLLYDSNTEYNYVSSWHLSRITYPNLPSSEGITFSYSDSVHLVQEIQSKKTFATAPLSGGVLTFENTEVVKSKTETGVRYLEGIHFSKGDITFNYDNERNDLPGAKRLTSVTLSDKSGNQVSTYSFVQDYFSAHNSYYMGNIYSTNNQPEDYRLKLESIYRDGALVQSYEYRNEIENISGTNINRYELPPRDSYYTDHWGYNNADDDQGTTYTPYPEINNLATEDRPAAAFNISGMKKEPKIYAQANILSKINFPTGGHTLYTYEKHTLGGGVRLNKVETFDENEDRVAGSSFVYESPVAFTNPVYHRTEDLDYKIATLHSGRDRLAIYENSLSNVLDLNGTSIGYGKVTVTDLMRGSKTEHYFRNDLRLSTVRPDKHSYTIADDGTFLDHGAINTFNHAPFSTNSLIYYDRGSYISMKVFGEDDPSSPIFERTYNYENINSSPYYIVPALAVEVKKDHGTSQDILVSQYDMQVKTYRLNSTTETSYENGGEVTRTTNFTYHNTFPTLTSQVDVDNSRGYDSRNFYSYPVDITSSTKHHLGTLGTMQAKNMNGVVVQSESQVNFSGSYETTQVSLTRYKSEHSLIVPHRQYTLMETPKSSWLEDDLIMINENINYNADGLLLSRKGFDEVITNMEYDSYGFLTKTIVNPGTVYERTTEYDNKRLVGLNKVTDANGRKVSYEYDDRNRLLITRDNDNNITSRYRYHTISDNNELNAEIIVEWHVDGNYEDRTHQFALQNINCPYGECTYTWSWGDGSSTSSSGVNASHEFTNSGSYVVNVVISNPEYNKPVVITKNVTIEDATLWTLTLIDPQDHCIYDSNPPQAFSANIDEGVSTCSPVDPYTYEWFYQYNSSGNFLAFGTGQQYEDWPQNTNVTGTHQIRVKVTDNCGRSLTVTKEFEIIGDNGGSCQDTGGGSGPH